MPLVVGIDEAGYGPLLGPLVIGATLWRVVPEHVDGDYWALLEPCVCRSAKRGELRVPVGDSKAVYDRKRGIHTLERSVLAFVHSAGISCDTLDALLRGLGFDHRPTMPWYDKLDCKLPRDPARSAYDGAAQKLTRHMARCGLSCGGMRTQLLTEDLYNDRVAQTRNKASVLIEAVLRLVHWASTQARDQDLVVRIDRLGGRADYRELLMRAFPDRHLQVVEQNDARSCYKLSGTQNDWRIEFCVDGDKSHLPIALASMLAKYVRELVMNQFNAYWQQRAPHLKPTAGYYKDAQRFLNDIAPLLADGTMRREEFVRAL